MLMVVVLHVLNFGGWLRASPNRSAMGLAIWLPETLSYCAVNCFAMVTGFVYCRARFKLSTLATTWLQVVLVNVVGGADA